MRVQYGKPHLFQLKSVSPESKDPVPNSHKATTTGLPQKLLGLFRELRRRAPCFGSPPPQDLGFVFPDSSPVAMPASHRLGNHFGRKTRSAKSWGEWYQTCSPKTWISLRFKDSPSFLGVLDPNTSLVPTLLVVAQVFQGWETFW